MLKENPTFSIIITCYNYENYIGLSIESAIAQTYDDVEIIVVNDGSTDNSLNVINRYSDKIKCISTENCGFISACLTGLAASSGSYIIFLDADDMLDEAALTIASGHLRDEVSKIQFMLQPIDADGKIMGDPFPKLPADYGSAEMIENIVRFGNYRTPPTSGNIYRRDIYFSLGSLKYDYGIDGVAYLAAPFLGQVVHLNQVLGKYRIHGQNMSSLGSNSAFKMEQERDIYRLRLEHLSELVGKDVFVPRQDYLYLAERRIFIAIAKGHRPNLSDTFQYIFQVNQSINNTRKPLYFLLAFLFLVLPGNRAASLVDFIVNPKRTSWMRVVIKRIVHR